MKFTPLTKKDKGNLKQARTVKGATSKTFNQTLRPATRAKESK